MTWPQSIKGGAIALGFVALEVLVCLPRLAGVLEGQSSDAEQYRLLVAYFQHQNVREQLRAPFAYRPLVPMLASLAPWGSLDVVNMIAFAAAVLAIDRVLSLRGVTPRGRALGALLSILSFPTLYYLAIGCVDAALLCVLAVGTWAILTERRLLAIVAVLAGALTKETSVVLLVVAAAQLRWRRDGKRAVAFFAALVIAFVGGTWIARTFAGLDPSFFWRPSIARLDSNISRFRMWASISLSFGVPALLATRSLLVRKIRSEDLPLLAGWACVNLVTLYAIVAAHADGRPAWMATPFTIPLALRGRST